MESSDTTGGNDSAAQETIARQAAEIEQLRRRLADERFAEELRQAFSLATTAGTIASPVTHTQLLEMIVTTAAHVISARAASLFLIDEETQELTFEVATGPKAEEVKEFRIPLGQGIAGLVAATGQAMAVSDVQSDPRHASTVAESIGYRPQSLLCVPLFYEDQVTGVLELLDKEDAPSFSDADMEVLGLFANQAAVAIQQSRTHQNLAVLIGEVLESLGAAPAEQPYGSQDRAQAFARHMEEDSAYWQALELARLVQEIVWQGENERRACQSILRSFAEYLRSRTDVTGNLGAMQ